MTILDEIVDRTRETLKQRRSQMPESGLRELALFEADRRGFAAALSTPNLSVIAEIKRASPSKGLLTEDFHVGRLAQDYESGGASAVSVLTEPDFFRGALGHLPIARAETSLPLLRKDFVVDPYQVVEARAYGADAVLLIATVLERNQLSELILAAAESGLDHLVEVYSEEDLDKVDFDLIRVLGVNTRNLETFEVDTTRLARVFAQIPIDLLRVAESGISGPSDIAALQKAAVDAVLVGEALIRSKDPARLIRALLEEAGATLSNAQPTPDEDKT